MIRVENPKFLPKIKKGAFTPEEVKRMLQVLPSEWCSMVICCLYTGGQRIGDVALLCWEQIDMERRQLSLVTGKTGRSMSIPTVDRFMEHLRSIPRNGPYLHPRMAEKYLRRGLYFLSIQKGTRICGDHIASFRSQQGAKGRARAISPKTFHSLRATAATLLHLSGVSPAIAQKVVGHESMDVHEGYVRPDDADSRNAMEKLSSALAL